MDLIISTKEKTKLLISDIINFVTPPQIT